ARIDLVHGRFVPSGDDLGEAGVEVEGRKLGVAVRGQTFAWETLGYSDTLGMPALPPGLDAVAAFVGDGRVRPTLAHWGIGWRERSLSSAGDVRVCDRPDATYPGTDPSDCSRTSCGNHPRPGKLMCTIAAACTSACNGNGSYDAVVVREDAATWGWNQDVVSMCCGSDPAAAFHAVKTCAWAAGSDGKFCSACGCSLNKCVACFSMADPGCS